MTTMILMGIGAVYPAIGVGSCTRAPGFRRQTTLGLMYNKAPSPVMIGMPLEKALNLLPDKWAEVVNGATRKSLETALQAALLTLDDKPQPNSWEFLPTITSAPWMLLITVCHNR